MRASLIIAAREITERRSVLLAAVVASVLPFLSPFAPGVGPSDAGAVRAVMSVVIAVGFAMISAIFLGASAVGRDLSEGRFGFDFARPIPTGAIWAGRLGGALALALIVLGVILLPSALLDLLSGAFSRHWFVTSREMWVWLWALVLLVPLAHAVGLAFRSRSGWLIVDLVAGLVVLILLGACARGLYDVWAIETLVVALVAFGIVLAVTLWLASAVQVAAARTDLRRGHRVLSLVVWSVLFTTALGFAAFVGWFLTVDPTDLVQATGHAAPRGAWVAVQGSARWRIGYEPVLLIDTASGRFVRLGAAPREFYGLEFSGDGRHAASVRLEGFMRPHAELVLFDLDDSKPRPLGTRISFTHRVAGLALSEDGRRVAVLDNGALAVYELPEGRILAAMKLFEAPAGFSFDQVAFVAKDRVRVYRCGDRLEIYEADVASRRITMHYLLAEPSATSPGEGKQAEYLSASWTREHDRVLVNHVGKPASTMLVDGTSGAVLTTIATSQKPWRHHARLLADGGVAFVESKRESAKLRLYSREGIEEREVSLPGSGEAVLGGEIASGQLVVVRRDGSKFENRGTVLTVGIEDGTVRTLAGGLWPELSEWPNSFRQSPEPGSLSTRLFRHGQALVLLDPVTGEERPLAEPASRP